MLESVGRPANSSLSVLIKTLEWVQDRLASEGALFPRLTLRCGAVRSVSEDEDGADGYGGEEDERGVGRGGREGGCEDSTRSFVRGNIDTTFVGGGGSESKTAAVEGEGEVEDGGEDEEGFSAGGGEGGRGRDDITQGVGGAMYRFWSTMQARVRQARRRSSLRSGSSGSGGNGRGSGGGEGDGEGEGGGEDEEGV